MPEINEVTVSPLILFQSQLLERRNELHLLQKFRLSPPTELRPKNDQDQRQGGMFYKETTLQFVTQTYMQELLT